MSQSRSLQTASYISRSGKGLPPSTPPGSPLKKGRDARKSSPDQDVASWLEKAAVTRAPARAKSCGKLCTGTPARGFPSTSSYAGVKGMPLLQRQSSPPVAPSLNTLSSCLAAGLRSYSTPALPAGPSAAPQGTPLGGSWQAYARGSSNLIQPAEAGTLAASWPASKSASLRNELQEGWSPLEPVSKALQFAPSTSPPPASSPAASSPRSPHRSFSKGSSGSKRSCEAGYKEDCLQDFFNEKNGSDSNLNSSLRSTSTARAAMGETNDSATPDDHDDAECEPPSPASPSCPLSPYTPHLRRTRSRPWRISKEEAQDERAEAEQILAAGSDVAGANGVNVRALVLCMLAQECLDEQGGPGLPDETARLALAPALEALRQVATNASPLEDVRKVSAATMEAFEAAGFGDALKGRLKRPTVGKHDICQRVLPGLWLGSWMALNNDCEELRRRKVTHVVSVVSTERCCELPSFIRHHLHVLAHDTEDAAAGLSAHFPEVCRFVDAARKEPRGIVYIHCGAGISRAPTVAASYLMWKLGVPAAGALDLIRRARPNIRPNLGFIKMLRQWEVDMLSLPK